MDNIFTSIISGDFTVKTYALCMLAAFACGAISAFSASFKNSISKSFAIALLLIPPTVATVITMVNGNIGTGIAVAGAFSLVRFRSAPGKAKDIVCIFSAMTAGIACAAGYVTIAIAFTIAINAVMAAVALIPFGSEKSMSLHITIPESLNFANEFDDLFDSYTSKHRLVKVKTTNMGSLYKLFYEIEMKEPGKMQEFIDKLRCRNGNLEVMISESVTEGSEQL